MSTDELCPVCGGHIRDNCVIKDGIAYCCDPCAKGDSCICQCCTVADLTEESS